MSIDLKKRGAHRDIRLAVQLPVCLQRVCWGVIGLLVLCGGCRQDAEAPPEKGSATPEEQAQSSELIESTNNGTSASNDSAVRPPEPSYRPRHQTDATSVRPDDAEGSSPSSTSQSSEHASPEEIKRGSADYRPSDTRPEHNDLRLAEFGIHRYESKRLRLYTDIDPKIARTLPPLVDQIYDVWEDYFEPLPPNREGTDYQITGYIMGKQELFRELELLPEDLPDFLHGRHRGAEFWMNDQERPYYRRHLMLHEATHCFMTTLDPFPAPVWYLEGMAELFGTHRIDAEGTAQFAVMPNEEDDFSGWGRIDLIRRSIQRGECKTMDEVTALVPNDFLETEAYAWSWALCQFFYGHPRYRDAFQRLGHQIGLDRFRQQFFREFDDDLPDLRTEWILFVHQLQDGYDQERAAIDFQRGSPIAPGERSKAFEIEADRGWQSSGVLLEQGHTYRVRSEGRCTLAQEPSPWISEPQGVSIRYFDGRPLGMLLGCLQHETSADMECTDFPMLDVIPVGRDAQFTAPVSGTFYLRINDSWSELADNDGRYRVVIEALAQ